MAARAGVGARLRENIRRLDGPPRLPGIDLARGLAVIGMFAAHLYTLPEVILTDPSTWTGIPGGRSSILFALLAGVSIALVTGGTQPVTGARRARRRQWLARRALALWVLGLLLIMTGVPVYVILPAYGILFVMALPFLGLGAGALAAWAAAIGLIVPWVLPLVDAIPFWDTLPGEAVFLVLGWAYPAVLWIAFVLAGMALGRLDLTRVRLLWLLAGVGAAGALAVEALVLAFPADPDTYLGQVWRTTEHSGGLGEVLASTGFATAVLALSILACRTWFRVLALPIRTLGSMPLTAYSAQILIWAVWAFAALGTTTDLFGFRALDPFWPVTLLIVAGCLVWALLWGRGPLERLVDRVSGPRLDRLGE